MASTIPYIHYSSSSLGLFSRSSSFFITVGTSIGPDTKSAYDLGSPSLPFRNIYGTSSVATSSSLSINTTSASYALTASFASNAGGLATSASHALIADTASFVSGIVASASYALTASLLLGSVVSSSHALIADTASYFSGSISNAIFANSSTSASYASTASLLLGSVVSASYALSASFAPSSPSVSASYALSASYSVTTTAGGSGGTDILMVQVFS